MGRDEHGHVQRLPPAVLAVRDERSDQLEHFAWGVMPEIAVRLGHRAGDLEAEQKRRAEALENLVRTGVLDVESVRAAIREIAGATASGRPRPN